MKIWILQFTRWPGYEAQTEVVGIFSSEEKARDACPYKDQLESLGEKFGPEKIIDPNGDYWLVYSMELDGSIHSEYPTWGENDQ